MDQIQESTQEQILNQTVCKLQAPVLIFLFIRTTRKFGRIKVKSHQKAIIEKSQNQVVLKVHSFNKLELKLIYTNLYKILIFLQ